MKHSWRQLTAWFLVIGILLPPQLALAQVSTDFNPNYLVSDEDLQNVKNMNREDIQAFLDSYGGLIATYRTIDLDGVERSVAEMIYNAAQKYQINPKYLLVKLQKEQGLVTDKNPTQKQLDWATGYGVCDSCNLSDPSLQKFKGLATQIDSAAGIIRWYYDHQSDGVVKKPNVTYAIDNVSVQPINLATAFLYTYTPHLTGNKNFWTLWQRWFDQIYPNGTLLKSDSGPTVYLIQDKTKRPFASFTALSSRADPRLILTAPDSELSRYETGKAITLPNYAVVQYQNNYYLVDHENLRPFASPDVVKQLGYNPDEIIQITTDDVQNFNAALPITADLGNPFGRLLLAKENKQLYYLKDSVLHLVTDEQIAKIAVPNLTAEKLEIADLAAWSLGSPLLFPDGALVGTRGTNDIYVIESGARRHIASDDVFIGLGYKRSNIIWTDELTILNHRPGQALNLRQEPILTDTGDADSPLNAVPIPEKMVVTPAAKTKFIGAEFDTPVNTYLVAEAKTGKIIASKNIDDVRPMASFAKVMTGYRLFKEGVPLWKSTTYKPKKYQAQFDNFRLASNEVVRNTDLMNALLVSSLNTPANMLVANVETKRTAFVKRMNEQAKKWKLKNTNFADPAGENTKNVTTARDYLTLYRKATENVDLRKLLGLASYQYDEVRDTDGRPHHFDSNSNHLTQKTNLPFTIITSKTAYLDEAGAGLTMEIERQSDKKHFILITMGNPDYANRFREPERLTRWAIANF